ncbi:MAG TPA: CopD family protein [Bacteroidia bacterium]|nr:CopD family protein [Bacteroidia bacterium]
MNLYLLALHIIFVVTWFAGLFYMPRLFIYHVEADKKPEPERTILQNQFKIMERRLWYVITWPSMIGVYIFGSWMVSLNFWYYFSSAWFILKLVFVFGLTLYHVKCHSIYTQLQKDIIKYSSLQLRIWNEVAAVFLVAIVFIVILKNQMQYLWGVLGIFLLIVTLFLAIKIYKGRREKKKEV